MAENISCKKLSRKKLSDEHRQSNYCLDGGHKFLHTAILLMSDLAQVKVLTRGGVPSPRSLRVGIPDGCIPGVKPHSMRKLDRQFYMISCSKLGFRCNAPQPAPIGSASIELTRSTNGRWVVSSDIFYHGFSFFILRLRYFIHAFSYFFSESSMKFTPTELRYVYHTRVKIAFALFCECRTLIYLEYTWLLRVRFEIPFQLFPLWCTRLPSSAFLLKITQQRNL